MTTASPPSPSHPPDEARVEFLRERRAAWDDAAEKWGSDRGAGAAYHRRIREVYRLLARPGQRVLELGSATGDLLAALEPSEGVGVDLSPRMVELARGRHQSKPSLRFVEGDAAEAATLLRGEAPFDVIVLSDLLNDLWDVQAALRGLHPLCHSRTRVLLNCYSRLWQWPLGAARRLGLAKRQLEQNWLTVHDATNLLELSGFEVIRQSSEVLLPLPVPLVAGFANRVLAKIPPFRWFDLSNVFVARPAPDQSGAGAGAGATAPHAAPRRAPTVTVVVPARNEQGNIERIIDETPQLGGGTQLLIVEGNSTDDTWATIQRVIADRKLPHVTALKQPGRGKNDAVREGFKHATGDILLILDADLTVHPATLPHFYEAIASGTGEFINGVRLVYPMEEKAMRFLNLVANRFFGAAFSWLLGQPIRDTLCGTKVIWREDYLRLAANRAYFGEFDPFGDFDLIFGAAKLNLRIRDLPIRYRERTYGETNIHRWRHGMLLFRMLWVAMRKLKFV